MGSRLSLFDFSWMIGRHITSVSLTPPCWWTFAFDQGGSIGVPCPWRLLEQGSIRVSSDDHEQQFGLPQRIDSGAVAASVLARSAVTNVEIREGTADLLLRFENDIQLEIIPFSSGYESWSVASPSGGNVFAQGGGQISGYER